MLENDFKRKHVGKFLSSLGGMWFDYIENAYGNNGLPDIIGCRKGRFFAIETKRSATQANPGAKSAIKIRLQQWTLDKMKESGGLIYKVYPENFTEFKQQFLNDTLQEAK